MKLVLSGLKAWLWQRLSALVILIGSLYFLLNIYSNSWDYASWSAWLKQDLRLVFLVTFIVAILVHSWIGVRDVILDYVKPFTLRLAVLAGFAFGLFALGVWVLLVLTGSASGT